jgi:hypothetical protein
VRRPSIFNPAICILLWDRIKVSIPYRMSSSYYAECLKVIRKSILVAVGLHRFDILMPVVY